MSRSGFALRVALAVACFGPGAHAQDAPSSSARAQAVQLFDIAQALFAKGQYAEACPKFAESYRLDPQIGVLLNTADCYEKNGQLASAWGAFREGSEMAAKRGDERASLASQRASSLESRLSRLVIQVGAAARVAGLVVRSDGALVGPALWGTPAAVDPGSHRIEVSAPGFKPWKKLAAVTVEGKVVTVEVPPLEKLGGNAEATPVDVGTASGASPEAASDASPASPGSGQRITGLTLGGLGIVGLGVGAFFGLSAQNSFTDSKDLCNSAGFCTDAGTQLRKDANSQATLSTVTVGVGLAALVTGGILWLTAPKKERASLEAPPRARGWAVGPTTASWGLEVQRDF